MFWRHNALGLLWAALIFVLLSLPGEQFEKSKQENLDKAVHLILFAVLYILLVVGFIKQRDFPVLRRNPHSIVMVAVMLYGVLIEVLQSLIFIGRSIELGDIVFNAIGCLSGYVIFMVIYGREAY